MIPLHAVFQGRSPVQLWGFRKIEAALLPKSVEKDSRKVQWIRHCSPVLKLTQVGEESILRRSRELRLRN